MVLADICGRLAVPTPRDVVPTPVARPSRAAGAFRPMTHTVDQGVPPIDLHGVPLWFALCGATCVPLTGDEESTWEACADCPP
jgi:hypothetical protein